MDPSNIVRVEDYSRETVAAIVEMLEMSRTMDQYVYRESELDALWSQVEVALRTAKAEGADQQRIEQLERLLSAAMDAHNLVARDKPKEAAARLRDALAVAT